VSELSSLNANGLRAAQSSVEEGVRFESSFPTGFIEYEQVSDSDPLRRYRIAWV